MNSSEIDTKKSAETTPTPVTGSLISFDEFDQFFDDFLLRRWPRLLDWNLPRGIERGFPKVDILDHDQEMRCRRHYQALKKKI